MANFCDVGTDTTVRGLGIRKLQAHHQTMDVRQPPMEHVVSFLREYIPQLLHVVGVLQLFQRWVPSAVLPSTIFHYNRIYFNVLRVTIM